MGLDTNRSLMARAILEGVALNLRWLRRPVEKFSRRQFSHYVFYGGGAESDAWCQIMADVLQRPVHQVAHPHYTTCLGVALVAFRKLGHIGFDDFEKLITIRRVFEPNPANGAIYDRLYKQFIQAFKRNRPIFRALNNHTD
jgi:xylulokinase